MNADSALRALVAKWEAEAAAASASGHEGFSGGIIHCIESILAAPQAAPAGMVLVPRHPKSDVIGAMQRAHSVYAPGSKMERAYAAMCEHFAAAPAAQVADRDAGGRLVREAWIRWAQQQPSPKPSWLAPYDDLSEADKEADRQIYEAVMAAAPAVVVDEAMVERACRNRHGEMWPIGFPEDYAQSCRRQMRADLAAALNQGKANGGG